MGFNANLSKFTCFFSVYTDKLYGIKQIHETGKSRIASVAAPKTCSIALVSTFEKKMEIRPLFSMFTANSVLKTRYHSNFPYVCKRNEGLPILFVALLMQ